MVSESPMRDKRKQWFLWLVLAAWSVLALTILSLPEPRLGQVASASQPAPLQARHVLAADVMTRSIFLPIVTGAPGLGLAVNPQSREASKAFFNQVYQASEGASAAWTGSHAACDAGTTADDFRWAVQLRINYFRAMAGVPGDVQLSEKYNRKAQQAALMMSVNDQLSHSPPSSWLCFSEEGREAAGSSNLYLGVYGPSAITGYIYDPGGGNYPVGHRRWILYPQTQWMGSGDIPPSGSYRPSNALWVFGPNLWGPRPQTREEYVAWPPPGYVPYQVVFPRWSFSYAQADFSSATVEMSTAGGSIPLTLQPVVNGYGENTLVWEPGLSLGSAPGADTTYTVVVRHVGIDAVYRDFVYQVTIFDPGLPVGLVQSDGDAFLGTPPESSR